MRYFFASREAARSPRWRAVRKAFIQAHPTCAKCGGGRLLRLEAHHVIPFHEAPELELDPANLITLCRRLRGGHHLSIGHLGDWTRSNAHVREDAARPDDD